jgi:hypothetical protein
MNLTWPNSLDQLWTFAGSPMWLAFAAAGFFAVIVLITLVRADRSVANGALTVITLLAVGIAVASATRSIDPNGAAAAGETHTATANVTLPALTCVDDLAGDLVLTACEKVLYGSAESTAAAVSYAAAMISRLTATGDVATANKAMTPELLALRRAVERDRFGLMAYVLLVRDRCTPSDCVTFRSVTDRQQLVNNMDGRTYEGLVTRYASQWNAPQPAAAAGPFAGLAPTMPPGKPTNAEFPSSASTPPVSIMTSEPTASTSRSVAQPATQPGAAPRPPSPTVAASHAQAPAKKSSAPLKLKPPATTPEAAPDPGAPPAE